MELSHQEWLEIKDWLEELYYFYDEQAEIFKNYRKGTFYNEECGKIKAFLDSKRR